MILSVLDRSPIPEGSTAAAALHDTLDLAELAARGADVPHPGWQAAGAPRAAAARLVAAERHLGGRARPAVLVRRPHQPGRRAESDDEAERPASSSRMMLSLLRQGRLIEIPPVEKALRYLETRERTPDGSGRGAIIGLPPTVRARLEEVAEEYGADEAIVLTITHDHGARRRSYELIAEAFGLEPAAPSSSVATAR